METRSDGGSCPNCDPPDQCMVECIFRRLREGRVCPICKADEAIVFEASYGGGWYAFCDSCYDGAPDAGRYPMGHGRTKEAALSALRVEQEMAEGDDEIRAALKRGELGSTSNGQS